MCWCAKPGDGEWTRTGKDGVTEVLADNYQGKKLNSPNDISLDSQGRIHFTDPRYGRMDNLEIKDETGQFVEGVCRIDGPGKVARILAHEVERPNGILVSPDDRCLYVTDNYNNRTGGAVFGATQARTIEVVYRSGTNLWEIQSITTPSDSCSYWPHGFHHAWRRNSTP